MCARVILFAVEVGYLEGNRVAAVCGKKSGNHTGKVARHCGIIVGGTQL